MGNYNARKDNFLKAWQINVAGLMFRGLSDDEIAREQFDIAEGDTKGLENVKKRLRTLRKNEKFQEYYRSIITEWSVHNVGKALCKLADQIDSDKPWVANKAANDVLLHSRTFMSGGEDNTMVIKVEGMPDLGIPDE